MKKRKIIHIYYRAHNSRFPRNDSEYYYLAGWSSTVARQTVKYVHRYTVENWRPETDIKKPVVREVQGIVCRLFPAVNVWHFGDWSPSLIRELRTQRKDCEILLHHHTVHRNPFYLIACLHRKTPIVAQCHGDPPTFARYLQNKKLTTLLIHHIESGIVSNVDHIFVLGEEHKEYLSRMMPSSNITIQPMGIDFRAFRPIDKKQARDILELSHDRKIILYVGKFYKLKGIEHILKVYNALKRKYEVDLILIGGSSKDQYYNEVKSSGANVIGHLPHDKLRLYYSAADVYLNPAFVSPFSGIGVAIVESLACGTPVVSTTLKDWPSNDWQEVGKIPREPGDLARCVAAVLDNPAFYSRCREIAQKYYDWENIIANTIRIYDDLFQMYYD